MKTVERGWAGGAHPDLAELISTPRRKRALKKVGIARAGEQNATDIENHIALAQASRSTPACGRSAAPSRDGGRHNPTARVCRLMAEVEERPFPTGPASIRRWLSRARRTPGDRSWRCARHVRAVMALTREARRLASRRPGRKCESCGAFGTPRSGARPAAVRGTIPARGDRWPQHIAQRRPAWRKTSSPRCCVRQYCHPSALAGTYKRSPVGARIAISAPWFGTTMLWGNMLRPRSPAASLPNAGLATPNVLWAPGRCRASRCSRPRTNATYLAIRRQSSPRCGPDIVSDGEQARQHFVHGFLAESTASTSTARCAWASATTATTPTARPSPAS